MHNENENEGAAWNGPVIGDGKSTGNGESPFTEVGQ